MSEFILVWVLITLDTSKGSTTYSPPVKTIEDCQRMQEFIGSKGWNVPKCIQVSIPRNYK